MHKKIFLLIIMCTLCIYNNTSCMKRSNNQKNHRQKRRRIQPNALHFHNFCAVTTQLQQVSNERYKDDDLLRDQAKQLINALPRETKNIIAMHALYKDTCQDWWYFDKKIEHPQRTVYSLSFSPADELAIGFNKEVRFIDSQTYTTNHSFTTPISPFALAYNQQGTRLAYSSENKISLYDTQKKTGY